MITVFERVNEWERRKEPLQLWVERLRNLLDLFLNCWLRSLYSIPLQSEKEKRLTQARQDSWSFWQRRVNSWVGVFLKNLDRRVVNSWVGVCLKNLNRNRNRYFHSFKSWLVTSSLSVCPCPTRSRGFALLNHSSFFYNSLYSHRFSFPLGK